MSSAKPGNIRKTLNILPRFRRKQPFLLYSEYAEATLTGIEYLFLTEQILYLITKSHTYAKNSIILRLTADH